MALLEELRAASVNATPGPSAARSQDFLYDEDGPAAVIAVDTSALMAIALDEPLAKACQAALAAEDDILISAGTLAEVLIVSARRRVGARMAVVLNRFDLNIVSVTQAMARRVGEAYEQWGRGMHPASLNFGDCFAYALAKERACRLLHVGEDFAKTDVESVL